MYVHIYIDTYVYTDTYECSDALNAAMPLQ